MHRIGIWLCSCSVIAVGTTSLLGASIERFQYRYESLDSGSADLTPSAYVAVFLSAEGDEGDVRAGLLELGVGEADVERSMLAGTLLVSTARVRRRNSTTYC